jgi:hypothetical protein
MEQMAGKSKIGIIGVVAAALLAGAALGQPLYHAPRDAYGRPDLQGVWTNETLTRFERPAAFGGRATVTAAEVAALEPPDVWRKVMRVGAQPRTSLLTTPDGRVPAMKTGAAPDPRAYPLPTGGKVTDNPETQAIDDRCLLPIGSNAGPVMLPLPNNSNYQIVQTRDQVAILVEMIHDVRLIRLGGTHRTDGLRPWLGDSIGRFEGDTLVVETTNFPAAQAFRGSWRNLKVTERFTRVARDRLRYRFTVEDATKWDKPWGGEYEFQARDEPIEEYACREGEKSVEHMLDAARAEERAQGR